MSAAVSGMVRRQHLWDRLEPIDGVYMTCTAMCGSGYKTAIMVAIGTHLLTGLRGNLGIVLIACCVVVRGITFHGPCVLRFASGLLPKTSPTISSVFALPGLFSEVILLWMLLPIRAGIKIAKYVRLI